MVVAIGFRINMLHEAPPGLRLVSFTRGNESAEAGILNQLLHDEMRHSATKSLFIPLTALSRLVSQNCHTEVCHKVPQIQRVPF